MNCWYNVNLETTKLPKFHFFKINGEILLVFWPANYHFTTNSSINWQIYLFHPYLSHKKGSMQKYWIFLVLETKYSKNRAFAHIYGHMIFANNSFIFRPILNIFIYLNSGDQELSTEHNIDPIWANKWVAHFALPAARFPTWPIMPPLTLSNRRWDVNKRL